MKITLLGTGTSQGVPVMGCNCEVCLSTNQKDKRLRTSAFIEIGGKNILIDCGPDFRQQMLQLDVQQVDAVLITHEHQDHIAGLDELRSFIFKQDKPMPVYAEERVILNVKQRFPYAFSTTPYPGAPSYQLHHIQPGDLHVEGVEIEALRLEHGKLPVLGFKIGRFAYLTDLNRIPKESKQRLENLDVLILDALHHRPHHSHYNVHQALEVIDELKPEKAYLTHISHSMGRCNEMNMQLPENVELAYDGITFEF